MRHAAILLLLSVWWVADVLLSRGAAAQRCPFSRGQMLLPVTTGGVLKAWRLA